MHNDLSDTSPRTPGIYIYFLNHWVKELTVGVSRLLYKVPDSNYFRFVGYTVSVATQFCPFNTKAACEQMTVAVF